MARIQIIAIVISLLFLLYIGRLIVKGKLREEYSILWVACTFFLILFSFWRNGIDVVSKLIGIVAPPNLIFTGAIFALMIYIVHLSVAVSKLQEQNKTLAQELAILKQKQEQKDSTLRRNES